MLTRRTFLFNGLSTIGLLTFTGCARIGEKRIEGPEAESGLQRVDIHPHPQAPRLLLFQQNSISAAQDSTATDVRVVAMELGDLNETDHATRAIKLLFSNGQSRTLKGNAKSYCHATADGGEMIQREGVLIKNLISSILDSLSVTAKKAKPADSLSMIRGDFSHLQEEDVLKSAPIGAVYLLASEISRRENLRRVLFDRQQLLFKVS